MHDQRRRTNLCYSEKNDHGPTAVTVKSNSFRGSAQVWRLGGGSETASLRRGAGARRVQGVGWGLERWRVCDLRGSRKVCALYSKYGTDRIKSAF